MTHDRCTCDRYKVLAPDGMIIDAERVRDPNCREHGFPTDDWPAGHPLRRHRRWIDRHTGDTVTWEEARERLGRDDDGLPNAPTILAHFRAETPRETEERLYRESLGRTA